MIKVNYRQFDEILRSYGFLVREPEQDTRVYNHPETGALLVFPIFPPDEQILMRHLVAARMTLGGYGLASEEEFEARLRQAG
ncbi:MAG: hypothetical protein ACRC33_27845 [Gemmataceae bacterium]